MNEYIEVVTRKYAQFSDRARRREFWMFLLVNGIIGTILSLPIYGTVIGMVMQPDTETDTRMALFSVTQISIAIVTVYALAVMVPSIAVTVRRLHDAGFSGWLYLLTFLGLGTVILVLCVLDSKPGSNKWGPNPKGVTDGNPAPEQNW